jgi:hypothetical protein
MHYVSRPKPWSAEYTGFNIDKNHHLMFMYALKNNTEKEYTVTGKFAAIKNSEYVYVGDSYKDDPPLAADYSGKPNSTGGEKNSGCRNRKHVFGCKDL